MLIFCTFDGGFFCSVKVEWLIILLFRAGSTLPVQLCQTSCRTSGRWSSILLVWKLPGPRRNTRRQQSSERSAPGGTFPPLPAWLQLSETENTPEHKEDDFQTQEFSNLEISGTMRWGQFTIKNVSICCKRPGCLLLKDFTSLILLTSFSKSAITSSLQILQQQMHISLVAADWEKRYRAKSCSGEGPPWCWSDMIQLAGESQQLSIDVFCLLKVDE